MDDMNYYSEYTFHPVGQGLFASGKIVCVSNRNRPFRWVYDCGTSSSKKLMAKAIGCFKCDVESNNGQSRPKLNLVTISHFDKDHVSGLVNLLSNFDVGTLLLPYMPLWQRLVIAFRERIDLHDDIMQYFVNPVHYIRKEYGSKVDRIILVPFSSKATQIRVSNAEEVKESRSDAEWELRVETRGAEKREEKNDITMEQANNGSILFMREGSTLRLSNVWEFLPYNDAELAPKANKSFRNNVEKERDALVSDSDSIAVLKRLKELYDKQFGESSRKRNMISLFLYGGPIDIKQHDGPHHFCCSYLGYLPPRLRLPYLCLYAQSMDCDRCSILYTGDGYLNTDNRLKALTSYLGDERIDKIHTLQVMHHGAKANWHAGVAAELKPAISVFCSDPELKKYGHPHASVLRNFVSHGPILVSKLYGLTISASWEKI